MSRKNLKKIGSADRHRFIASVSRFGTKPAYKGPPIQTVCLNNIKLISDDKEVCDHLWMTIGKTIKKLNLQVGDTIEFDARVSTYEKGYKGRDFEKQIENPVSRDWRLSFPTKMVKLEKCVQG